MKKVKLQDIADSLGVSRTTVWKVFSDKEGVSDELKDKIISRALEMDYSLPEGIDRPDKSKKESSDAPLNIALAVSRPESSIFWMRIIHQIAKEFSKQNINLVYTYLPSKINENYILPASLSNGNTQGMIIMNVYNVKLLKLLSTCDIPKVFFDTAVSVPTSELNGDVILMENYNSVFKLTKHLIDKGIKTFGFIGDINYAKSNHERYEGFLGALDDHNLALDHTLTLTGSIGEDTYKEEIELFLDTLSSIPQAFVCASDYVACLLISSLRKRNIRVPHDILVTGFDDNIESPIAENITTVHVYNQNIGMRLAMQILYRIKYPNMPYELSYIETKVIYRNSSDD
ncbi:LacI family DNA-binding transcriptional regulator [Blautia liquoris]|uniref:LacI family DNA-binding transcriptional regulator n=1 Tax=Blautia liquoris TaxID=2779518 RepID=A0A7M2RK62_9FIRM|nr:LacI family DNA-binding transcriptional regulator [Blautia liquoris]QOV20713.1 LacI family DNA-binding transcriptional regulator [Blautia liquoris]